MECQGPVSASAAAGLFRVPCPGTGRAREFLAAVEGLTRVEMDCRDGSLLLEYDTSRLGHADLFLLSLRLEALVRQG